MSRKGRDGDVEGVETTVPQARAAPHGAPGRRVSDLVLSLGAESTDAAALLARICDRLVEDGIPLWRVSTMLPTRHPEVLGTGLLWVRGAGCRSESHENSIVESPGYLGSPVEAIQLGSGPIRSRLDDPGRRRFPMVENLAREGATDYVMFPLPFRTAISGISWTTDRPGGFTDDDLHQIEGLLPALTVRFELESAYFATQSLLETYLGRNAARRVLAGAVRRGTGESIRAAIWICDLRRFTEMGDRLLPADLVSVLDRYFETVAGPIDANGGEILKFIGDAALAVFPIGARGPRDACRSALAAGEAALEAIGRIRIDAEAPLSLGVAMHVGDVMYGNIGTRDRLDFTVIGSSVNVTSRLQSLCAGLGVPLLASGAFAAAADRGMVSLGTHALKGLSQPEEVFTVPRLRR